jgi:hypothetical protein
MLDDLFPKPGDISKPFEARKAYIQAFNDLFAQLESTTAFNSEQKKELIDKVEENYKRSHNITSLSSEEQNKVVERQAADLFTEYRLRADTAKIYAEPTELQELDNSVWQRGVFQVMEWAKNGPAPLEFDMWEGQMQLWIQQDIVRAIRIANHMDEPDSSLSRQPIKRLLGIYVAAGYVGLDELDDPVANRISSAALGPTKGFSVQTRTGTEIATVEDVQQALNDRLPDNFQVSPTGRQTNPIYDVRHAYLSVIVDSTRIPEVLNAIGQVNYMTILGIKTTDIDEYQHLNEGYFYGQVDCVQLDIHIESIWLRSWTAGDLMPDPDNPSSFNIGLMPDDVRFHLGLPPRSPNYLAERTRLLAELRTTTN